MIDSPNIWVTPQARIVSQLLIDDLHIKDGMGLASVLNIAPNFSNFDAVMLWVQERYSKDLTRYSNYEILKRAFIGSVPNFLQGEVW